MSTPNPLVPQGSLLEQQAKSKSTFQVAAFIVGLHVVILGGLLFLGCKKEEGLTQTPPSGTDTLVTPPAVTPDTNLVATTYPAPTNAVVPAPDTNYAAPPPLTSVPPPLTPIEPSVPATPGAEHVIQKGDVAYKLAQKHGVTLKQLQEANPGVDLARLKVGHKLQIPAASAASAAGTSTLAATASAGGTTYTVKGGDNLSRLAKKFGTSVKAIREANNMTSNDIKVGQKLKIPGKNTAAATPEAAPAPVPLAPPTVVPGNPVVTPGQPQ